MTLEHSLYNSETRFSHELLYYRKDNAKRTNEAEINPSFSISNEMKQFHKSGTSLLAMRSDSVPAGICLPNTIKAAQSAPVVVEATLAGSQKIFVCKRCHVFQLRVLSPFLIWYFIPWELFHAGLMCSQCLLPTGTASAWFITYTTHNLHSNFFSPPWDDMQIYEMLDTSTYCYPPSP